MSDIMDPQPLKKVWFDMVRLLAFMDDEEDGLTPEERLYQARDLLFIIEKNYCRALSLVDMAEGKVQK
jgi:hypothetical protein